MVMGVELEHNGREQKISQLYNQYMRMVQRKVNVWKGVLAEEVQDECIQNQGISGFPK